MSITKILNQLRNKISNQSMTADDQQSSTEQPKLPEGTNPLPLSKNSFIQDNFSESLHADVIGPRSLQLKPSAQRMGDKWSTTLVVVVFPDTSTPGMLNRLLSTTGQNVDITYQIDPTRSRDDAIRYLKSNIQDTETEVLKEEERKDPEVRATRRKNEKQKKILDKLQDDEDGIVDIGIYITVRADTREKLNTIVSNVTDNIRTLTVEPWEYGIQNAMVSASPIGQDIIDQKATMLGQAAGSLFPFSSDTLLEENGVEWGYHAGNLSPIVFDRFNQTGYNVLILGETGSGKSFTTKLNILHRIGKDDNTIVFVVDSMDGYHDITDLLQGEHIPINRTKSLNPMAIEQHSRDVLETMAKENLDPYGQAVDSSINFFNTFHTLLSDGEPLSSEEQSVIELAISIAYARKEITQDPQTHDNENPTPLDVYHILTGMAYDPLPFLLVDRLDAKISPEILERFDLMEPLIEHYSFDEILNANITSSEGQKQSQSISTLEKDGDSILSEWAQESEIDVGSFKIPEGLFSRWKDIATNLGIAFRQVQPGGRYGHFGRQTNIDFSGSNFVYLDIKESESDQEIGLQMYLILKHIDAFSKKTDKKVILAIDEAHKLLEDEKSVDWLARRFRSTRHFEMSIQLMTQSAEDIITEKSHKVIKENTQTKIFHYLDLSRNQIEYLDLPEPHVEFISDTTQGEEDKGYTTALLDVQKKGTYPLKVQPFHHERRLLDSDYRDEQSR